MSTALPALVGPSGSSTRPFRARGMSWLRRGVSALVRLRLLRLSGTWRSYWAERFATLLRLWPSPA